METLPYELITLISNFLSTKEKERVRQVSKIFYYNVRIMDIKVEKMDIKMDTILDGRIYILNRLRLAFLSGLSHEKVANIWRWVENRNANLLTMLDALPFLREINEVL